ncbi:MAG: hypothetical protein HOP02_10130 [Methylococcaceae bacterium]|nr:hypothetical protein [Methylococcaceae bacterium]
MKKSLYASVLMLSTALVGSPASATTVQTLGVQNFFTDGAKISTGEFLGQVAPKIVGDTQPSNSVAPFNQFIGSDSASNFSTSWTFSYGALADVTAGSLQLGIYDHDSAAPGSQIASFSLNGIDLTTELNGLFEANGGSANSLYNIYTLTLPTSTLTQLASGTATFNLTLQGLGLSVLGRTNTNGAGLDFSRLTVTTVPLPASGSLLLFGLTGLLAARRKNRA